MPQSEILDAIRRTIAGRDVVLLGLSASMVRRHTAALERCQVGRVLPFTLRHVPGTGLPHLIGGPPLDDFLLEMQALERVAATPPPSALQAVHRWDPGGRALGLTASGAQGQTVLGRPRLGARRSRSVALEDKTVADAFFDRAGVPRLPSRVVMVPQAPRAAGEMDRGHGTVWSGDNRTALEGGAVAVRHVHDDATLQAAQRFFTRRCDRVRVSPFLEGLPCSVHGLVLDDGVAALRPVEMVVLRDRPKGRFHYCGASSRFDPAQRVAMRHAARRAGAQLRRELDYRGFFTLDGVIGPRGFQATEVNTRDGAGLSLIGTGSPFPWGLLDCVVRDRRPVRLPPAVAVEATLLAHADTHRRVDVGLPVPFGPVIPRTIALPGGGHGLWRGGSTGGRFFLRDVPTRPATPAAPTLVDALRRARAAFGPVIPDWTAAQV